MDGPDAGNFVAENNFLTQFFEELGLKDMDLGMDFGADGGGLSFFDRLMRKLGLNVAPGAGLHTERFIQKTAHGEHFDKMDSFYDGLSDEQKAAFTSPLDQFQGPGWEGFDFDGAPPEHKEWVKNETENHRQNLADFEDTLSPEQLKEWQDLKETATDLKSLYTPEGAKEAHANADGLDLQETQDGLSFAIENYGNNPLGDEVIDELGGIDAAKGILENVQDPNFDINSLDPATQKILLDAQNETYSLYEDGQGNVIGYEDPDTGEYVAVDNEQDAITAITDAFFDGESPEEVGASNGGVIPGSLRPDQPEPPAPNAPGNDVEVGMKPVVPTGPSM